MSEEFKKMIRELDEGLCPDKSFDLIKRSLTVADRCAFMYYIDGFIKDEMYEKIMEFFFKLEPEKLDGVDNAEQFIINLMPYVEVDYSYDIEKIKQTVLSGPSVIIVDGVRGAVIADTRTYPMRSITEPEKDKSLRGPRDGFVETVVMNTAMIRRRIRDEHLRMEYVQIGGRTHLDLAISYIEGLADEKALAALRKKLSEIKIQGISMTQQVLAETLVKSSFFNPFPKFKFTERPDYASACILDGRIALVMDNSPTVMILPASFSDFFRETDDYYFLPAAATYTRIVRAVVAITSVLATPLYLLLINNPQYIPECLDFLKLTTESALPLFFQFFILEFIVDGLKFASLNTPSTLSNSFGIIGGLLLSEFAINVGWFVAEAVLFTAFVTIAGYTQPSFEMGYAIKFERLILLITTQLFGLWGFIGTIVLYTIGMLFMRTMTGRDYMYPIKPFSARALVRLFVRPAVNKKH